MRRPRNMNDGGDRSGSRLADGGLAGGGGYARSWRWCSNGSARLRELDADAGELVRSWTAAATGLRTGGSAALCEWWREHGSDVWQIGGENGGQRAATSATGERRGAGKRAAAAERQRRRRGGSRDSLNGAVARYRPVGCAISTKSRRRGGGTRGRVSVRKSRCERNILRFAISREPQTSSRGNASWLGETFVYFIITLL
ncbi:hypothetical protein Syun_011930 [Stephania yunnanensis]|uniref:Uncharacterized protein n=1 Tax=Stephania yunnanensis TaxID=152371 RepID=A0AAP0K0Q9_9MAGN